MGEHQSCVGISIEQRVQRGQVHGALQDPSVSHVSALEVLEEVAMAVVGGRGILCVDPALIAGNVEHDVRLRAEQAMREDQQALLGKLRADFVNRRERRSHLVHLGKVLPRTLDASIRPGRAWLRRWVGELHLPTERRTIRRVLCHQVEQHRRTGARKPHDEKRLLDRDIADLWVLCAMSIDCESALKIRRERLPTHYAPDPRQVGFALDSIDENRQRLPKDRVPKVA